ncbi:methyltransferase domain-containing protein [Photobacterium sp. BZF1]|uniref:class I SAM-dependent methyltransferase n=1 Tax=Photobacterium sp. BZF1 TaxID=1904457 RepID=UPI001653633B|nr:class I SAM-dependent methyltransferase [Photobacterium sp. BZF1]MBC7005167.1 methyltransferase domain-containing protein [Photobacterium sp. BZF1]
MSLIERININKNTVDKLESEILFQRHIERYALARKYLYGQVCDVACGVGYGAYLCAKNPDVTKISGFDADKDAVVHAQEHFTTNRTQFECKAVESIEGKFDILMSLETIEHLKDPRELVSLAKRCQVNEILLSFPNKKTTHYNKWHLWDITSHDIKALFKEYYVLDEFDFYDSKFMHLVKGRPQAKILVKSWSAS